MSVQPFQHCSCIVAVIGAIPQTRHPIFTDSMTFESLAVLHKRSIVCTSLADLDLYDVLSAINQCSGGPHSLQCVLVLLVK